jgi:voltage-gated potassium channel
MPKQEIKRNPVKEKIHEIIFEADTFYGKFFDVSLLIVIVASILVVMLESIEPLSRQYLAVFQILEWTFTIIFTIEYLL